MKSSSMSSSNFSTSFGSNDDSELRFNPKCNFTSQFINYKNASQVMRDSSEFNLHIGEHFHFWFSNLIIAEDDIIIISDSEETSNMESTANADCSSITRY